MENSIVKGEIQSLFSINGTGEIISKKLTTGGPPLVRFLIVRIFNSYGFLKPNNSTIFLISTVFSTNAGNFWKFL